MQTTVTRQFRRRAGIFVASMILVFVAHVLGVLRPIETAFGFILEPTQRVVVRVKQYIPFTEPGEQSVSESGVSIDEIQQHNLDLQAENAELKTALSQAELAQEQLQYLQDRNTSGQRAHVTGRSTIGPQHYIRIDKGEGDGITAGNPVITGKGLLVGVVYESKATSSIVELITSPQLKLNAVIQNESTSSGIVSGSLSAPVIMDFIPQFDEVHTNDIVVTSGKDPGIPAGLIIGSITEIQANPGTLFQQAIIQPLTNIQGISIVSIFTDL